MGSVVFSCATILKIPLASAGNSNVALSDSTSAITSSSVTKSPSFFIQVEIVTSVIDSPTAGTFISLIAPVALGAAAEAEAAGAATAAGLLAAFGAAATAPDSS